MPLPWGEGEELPGTGRLWGKIPGICRSRGELSWILEIIGSTPWNLETVLEDGKNSLGFSTLEAAALKYKKPRQIKWGGKKKNISVY